MYSCKPEEYYQYFQFFSKTLPYAPAGVRVPNRQKRYGQNVFYNISFEINSISVFLLVIRKHSI